MLRMLDGITVMLDFDYLKIGQTDFVGIDRAFEQQAAPLPSMVSAVPLEAEVLHESQR